MTAVLFIGPSLPGAEARALMDVECLPPAAQGDIYRAAQRKPRVIGLVDGYFHGVPAVWHKEILWAMSEGIHVFGAASMGALRAAELHPFGMQGVGRIYDAFRNGEFIDDDEVAVLHGPAETGYAALTESMVNIRAALTAATQDGVVSAGTAATLTGLAKALYYQDRTWETLLGSAGPEGVPEAELGSLRAWLPGGRVDQKREDALALMMPIRAFLKSDPDPLSVDFSFEWTEMWDDAVSASAAVGPAGEDAILEELILDELRLDYDDYLRIKQQALLRALALREADRRRMTDDGDRVGDVLRRFRDRHGLPRRDDIDHWARRNDLSIAELEILLRDQARLLDVTDGHHAALKAHLIAELRLSGDYEPLAARARAKRKAVSRQGVEETGI